MKCPKCHSEGSSDSLFCGFCGQNLKNCCPVCRKINFPEFSFCTNCGQHLSQKSPKLTYTQRLEQTITQLQRYLPEEIRKTILSHGNEVKGERKHVTIMFCDLRAFTVLTEELGADTTFELMNAVFKILTEKVHQYQGVVNELRGDGILAFFGAPKALEDAPQRAIRSAISIHKALKKFNEGCALGKKVPAVELRIGINTGLVVVGSVGGDRQAQYTAMGDAINLASRIESIAEPGTTYVSEKTFKLTEGFFRFEAIGGKIVKNVKNPITVYRVIAPNNRRTRFDVNAERGLTSFIGRESELASLLTGYERAKEGNGQAFLVVSEPGMGKSRLLYEFRKQVAHDDVIFIEGKCLSYSTNIPFHLVIDILKAVFNIEESDSDQNKRNKTATFLENVVSDYISAIPYIFELLSLHSPRAETVSTLSPEAKKVAIVSILEEMLTKEAKKRPLILACEDLHWMDRNSYDVLRHLLHGIGAHRVFLILTARPEFQPTWIPSDSFNQLVLTVLTKEENLRMANSLLQCGTLAPALREIIEKKTEGIPFYTEEFIRSLLDGNLIAKKNDRYELVAEEKTLSIPASIHDVIMSRVDALPAGVKDILQICSVVEREFPLEIIKRVSGYAKNHLLQTFEVIKRANLVYEYDAEGRADTRYVFRHALSREVLYDSILKPHREKLHDDIGRTLEKYYHNNLEDFFAVLAMHFTQGKNYKKASFYARLAAKQSQKRSSFSDAIYFGKLCYSSLEKLAPTEEIQKEIINARIATSNYCMGINHHFDGMQAVAPVVGLVSNSQDKEKLPQVLLAVGSYKVFGEERFAEGIADLLRAKELALKQDDPLTYWYSVFFLGSIYWLEADFDKSIKHFQESLQQSKRSGSVSGACFSIASMCAWPMGYLGKLKEAYQSSQEALDMALKSNDTFIQQCCYSSLGCCCFLLGLFTQGKEYLLKADELYGKAGNIFWGSLGQFWLGELFLANQDFFEAIRYFTLSKETIELRVVLPSWKMLTNAKIDQCANRLSAATIDLSTLTQRFNDNKINVNSGIIAHAIADTLLYQKKPNLGHAKEWVRRAISLNSRYGNQWRLAGDYLLSAQILAKNGDLAEADKNHHKAQRLYASFGATGWIEKYAGDTIK